MKKHIAYAGLLFFLMLTGCASMKLMPSQFEASGVAVATHQEFSKRFTAIEDGKTTLADLKKMGLDPDQVPNVLKINYVEIRDMFLGAQLTFSVLPVPIQQCIIMENKCTGYRYSAKRIKTIGSGNLALRWLDIKKQDIKKGWSGEFYIFMYEDTVVYKLPGDTIANILEPKTSKNPTGFLKWMTLLLIPAILP